jgi:hypothetical protein
MNRLDQNQNKHLQTLERVFDFYNSHWWLRAFVHLAYFSLFIYAVYHRYDIINITHYGPYFWLYCGTYIVSYYFIFHFLISKLLPQKHYALFALLFLLWYFGPFSYVCFKYNEEIELLNTYNYDNWENINKLWIKIYEQYGLWGHFRNVIFAHNVFQEFISSFFFLGFVKSIKYGNSIGSTTNSKPSTCNTNSIHTFCSIRLIIFMALFYSEMQIRPK